MSWQQYAACDGVDHNLFFDAKTRDDALAICARCAYRERCLADEFQFVWKADGIHGVRAGMVEEDRRALYRMLHPKRRPTDAAWYYELIPA